MHARADLAMPIALPSLPSLKVGPWDWAVVQISNLHPDCGSLDISAMAWKPEILDQEEGKETREEETRENAHGERRSSSGGETCQNDYFPKAAIQ